MSIKKLAILLNLRDKIKMPAIGLKDKNYPRLLKEISGPPETLYILGSLPDNNIPKIAIVGTRKATVNGRLIAKKIAKELSEAGIIIVSGLAMGIDTAVHEGAVAAEAKTIAVLGNGLNTIYPAQNQNLAKKILQLGGTIISEYPSDEPAYPSNFLQRNRIISGLCLATVVVEAPLRSGSLVTARLALEQGREVFVVPGPADSFNYSGSHLLIRDGARLAASAKDILEDLNLVPSKLSEKAADGAKQELTNEEKIIFDIIKKNSKPLKIDKIAELAKLEIQTANQTAAFLLIKKMIKETPTGLQANN